MPDKYKITNPKTGESFVLTWNRPTPPTKADIDRILANQQTPEVPSVPPAEEEKTLAGFGKNILTSGGELLASLPYIAQGAGALKDAVAGLAVKALPEGWIAPEAKQTAAQKVAVADGLGNYYKDRLTHPLETAYSDPIGTLVDVSTLATGAAGATGAGAKLARLGGLARTADALGNVSKVASGIATVTDPVKVGAGTVRALGGRPLGKFVAAKLYDNALGNTSTLRNTNTTLADAEGVPIGLGYVGASEGFPVSVGGGKAIAKANAADTLARRAELQRLTDAGVRFPVVKMQAATEARAAQLGTPGTNPSYAGDIRKRGEWFINHPSVSRPMTEEELLAAYRQAASGQAPVDLVKIPTRVPGTMTPVDLQTALNNLKHEVEGSYGGLASGDKEGVKTLRHTGSTWLKEQSPKIAEINERLSRRIPLEEAIASRVGARFGQNATGVPNWALWRAITGNSVAPALVSAMGVPALESRAAVGLNRLAEGQPLFKGPVANAAMDLLSPTRYPMQKADLIRAALLGSPQNAPQ